MFIDIRNLQERRQARDSQFEDTRDIRNGYLFEVNGSVEGDRDGLVWFKALDGNSEPFQVFYNGIIGDLRANMFVKIERNPKDPARWQITNFDTGIYFDDQSTYEQLPSTSMIPKKEDYEWPPGFPGAKALNIFPRAITDFAVRPTSPASMKARVYSGIYPGATNYARFQGPVNTKDFTADVPGAGLARLAAISIDNSGTLNYTNGTTFVDGLPMPDASLPAVPASEMLISAIRLVNGMTAIEESNFDLEMRPLMANSTVNLKVSEVWESDFGAVALQADANGNIGIGTASPDFYLQVGDGASSLSLTPTFNTVLIGPDTTTGRLILEGTAQADIVLIDGGAGANDKASQIVTDGGITKFRSLSDAAGIQTDNILVMDHGNGNIGIGTAAPITLLSNLAANPTAATISSEGFLWGATTTGYAAIIDNSFSSASGLRIQTNGGFGLAVYDDNSSLWSLIATEGKVGIGTTTIPHGGVGAARLAIEGPNASTSGPHIQFTTASNNYPVLQILPFAHDSVHFGLDAYFDGSWKSSDIGSNFAIAKESDVLKFRYDSGITAGNVLTWNEGIALNTSGHLGVGTVSPQGILHTYDSISGSLKWEYDGLDATVRTVIPNGTGDVLYTCFVIYNLRDSAGAAVSSTISVANGASANVTVGTNTVRLRVNADGSFDAARIIGTDTIKIKLTLSWL